jgi:serine/threonine-protein kinase
MTDGARDLSAERQRGALEAPVASPSSTSTGGPVPVPLADPGPAVIAGRYRLKRELGRGGAAIVWLAHDLAEDHDVAVKILRPEIANTVASARFLEEIRIVTELTHPHLLPILGSGEWEGLLFYVTPFIADGSLRARLDREPQLPIDDALTIVKCVADALAYAHAHDVIHRDVKPENILIDGDHALVADFGIARALTRAAGDRITSTGISVGTPAYMSPEQAAGNRDLDQRTDIYSLACVLYEMLAGIAPFVGPTPESVIAQRFVHAPHPLRAYRATVSPEVERAVSCAMAISPADRPRTMDAFADTLFRPAPITAPTRDVATGSSGPRRWLALGAATAAMVAIAASLFAARNRARESVAAAADTTRYVVAEVSVAGIRTTPAEARARMTSALRRWRDLSVVIPPPDVGDPARTRSASGVATLASAAAAGRIVLASLSAVGDSVELAASLRDARGSTLREFAARAPLGDSTRAARLYLAASAALLGAVDARDAGGDWLDAATGTERLGAWRAYGRAQALLRRWSLDSAITELRAAVAQDPEYAQAQLWLAQASAWSKPERAEEWQRDAMRAGALASRLGHDDSLLATAVARMGSGEYPAACASYRRLLESTTQRELAWLGLGQCQAMDDVVVPDRRSPSGWAFRGSYHAAVTAYDSAVALSTGAPEFAFAQFGRLLFIDAFRLREGHAASSDTLTFLAHPSLEADTVAFVPWPQADVRAAAPRTLPATLGVALERNANLLAPRMREWARRAPASAMALATLADVQEVRGDLAPGGDGSLAAIATLRAAVRATTDSVQRVRQSAGLVRVMLKSELYGPARELADSLLASNPAPTPRQARYLAGVAALIGKLDRTERLLSVLAIDPASQPDHAPPPAVLGAAARLTANAALGACTPRLTAMVDEVDQLVARYVSPATRESVRLKVLSRPLSLAVPCLGPAVMERIPDNGIRLARMQRALARGDNGAVRAQMDTLTRMRRIERVGDIALDNTFQEAWVLLAMHDTVAAERHLCAPLSALPTLGTRLLFDVPQAAAVGRSFALCARMTARRGDAAAAQRWTQAVVLLWSSADPDVQSSLNDLRAPVASRR